MRAPLVRVNKYITLNLIYSQLSEPELKPKLIIPYYGKISETLKQKFKTLGYETIFKSSST